MVYTNVGMVYTKIIYNMKTQKTLNVNTELINELETRFPDVPFTKLVDKGLRLLLDPNITNKKVTLDDDVMGKFNRLCERVLDMHKEFINK